jgi:hypothetical protein
MNVRTVKEIITTVPIFSLLARLKNKYPTIMSPDMR